MKNCTKCNKSIQTEDEKEVYKKVYCEDCYLDEVMPKMSKAHYDKDDEFMNRLKDSYSVGKQKFH